MLVQLFSLSCLLVVQVSQALYDAELAESIVNGVESFIVVLLIVGPDTKISVVLVQLFSLSCLSAVQVS